MNKGWAIRDGVGKMIRPPMDEVTTGHAWAWAELRIQSKGQERASCDAVWPYWPFCRGGHFLREQTGDGEGCWRGA